MVSDHKTIMHIDMNAFFASVEQTANPFIRNKPVAVVPTPDYDNAAIVAASYQAKRQGIKSFMRLREARILCPNLIAVPSDFIKYYFVNRRIVSILCRFTPLVEVYSIDEAFLDLTEVLQVHKKTPRGIAQEIKDAIRREVGSELTSSVGLAPNKLLAKVGSNWKKPDGLTEISWEERFEYLDKVPIQDIWGIGFRGGAKLAQIGVTSTKEVRDLPKATLRGLVGSYYTRLIAIANGEWHEPVDPKHTEKPHQSMQHAHTLSRATLDEVELKSIIRKMSERLARRLRKFNQTARVVYLGLRPEKLKTYGWGSLPKFYGFEELQLPTAHGHNIYAAASHIFDTLKLDGTKIRLVAVGINDLQSADAMLFDIFTNSKTNKLDKAIDKINTTYGEFTVRSGDILHQYAKETELSVDREDMTFHPVSS